MESDGTHLHPLFPNWKEVTDQCCGSWSADGAYFYFQASRGKALGHERGGLADVSPVFGQCADAGDSEKVFEFRQEAITILRNKGLSGRVQDSPSGESL